MSSFSTSSKAAAAAAAAAAAGEAVHHIRRLSPSAPPASSGNNDWYPFQSEAEFNLNIAVALIFLVCFVIGAIGINALIKCVYHNSPDHQSSSSSSTAEEKLAQLFMGPTQIFSHELMLAGADHPECTICLAEFVEGEGLRVLPKCNHGFHVKCIESWLLNRNSCPTCRTSCLKTAALKNSPEDQQQQQQNDVDVEAANPPVTGMVVQHQQHQQQRNDVDEAANPPVTENLQDQQQQQQQNDIDTETANPPITENLQDQQQQQQQQKDIDTEAADSPVTVQQQRQQASE